MKEFKVSYREVLLHEFHVDAETKDQVCDKFCEMASNGEIDFSDGWLEDGDIISIEEV